MNLVCKLATSEVVDRIPELVAKTNPRGVREALDKLGTKDINDPRLLQAVDRTVNRGALNQAWQEFATTNPSASGKQIIDKMTELSGEHSGFRVNGAF